MQINVRDTQYKQLSRDFRIFTSPVLSATYSDMPLSVYEELVTAPVIKLGQALGKSYHILAMTPPSVRGGQG